MWTLQSAFPSSFWFWLALKRLFRADQNRRSPITAAESAPVLWRASLPAWHVQSLPRLYQIQIYTWLRMPRYSLLTGRLLREGTHASPFSPLPTTFTPRPFFSLSASTRRGCCNAHKRVSLESLQGAWVAVLQLRHKLGVFWLAVRSFGGVSVSSPFPKDTALKECSNSW